LPGHHVSKYKSEEERLHSHAQKEVLQFPLRNPKVAVQQGCHCSAHSTSKNRFTSSIRPTDLSTGTAVRCSSLFAKASSSQVQKQILQTWLRDVRVDHHNLPFARKPHRVRKQSLRGVCV